VTAWRFVADLVTHVGSALLVKAGLGTRFTPVFVVGVVLPDLAARVPAMLLTQAKQVGFPVPTTLVYGFEVLHMPAGMAALALLLALAWAEVDQRVRVWAELCLGCALHQAVDLLQHHFGVGYFLGWPVWRGHFELGWIGSEDTVLVAPVALAIGAGAWRLRRRVERAAAEDGALRPE